MFVSWCFTLKWKDTWQLKFLGKNYHFLFILFICVLPENKGGERSRVRKGKDVWPGAQGTGEWPHLVNFNYWLPMMITCASWVCEILQKPRSQLLCWLDSLHLSFILVPLFCTATILTEWQEVLFVLGPVSYVACSNCVVFVTQVECTKGAERTRVGSVWKLVVLLVTYSLPWNIFESQFSFLPIKLLNN